MLNSSRLVIAILVIELLLSICSFAYFKCRDPLRVGTWVKFRYNFYNPADKAIGIITRGPEKLRTYDTYWIRTGHPFVQKYYLQNYYEDYYYRTEIEPLSEKEIDDCYLNAKFELPGE